MKLERVEGPECPHCGCMDQAVLSRSRWNGRYTERRGCRHCGHIFSAQSTDDLEPEPPTYYPAILPVCPTCGSTDNVVTHTLRPIRHHRCRQCGERFKSTERKQR